ncbi:MAG: DUF4124 domain-containing protein [Xanthomonadales bacterium]|nr:DUF4124 domain-containing protein [Xanthomonadales bacterium]
MLRLPLAIVLLMLSPLSVAQIYSWTDAGGTVHYSEAPPEAGVHYKQISLTGTSMSPTSAPAATAPASTEAGTEATRAAAPAPPATPMADTPDNRARLCATLSANLTQLRGSAPLVVNKDGIDVVLPNNQRQAQLSSAETQYQQYCQNSQ